MDVSSFRGWKMTRFRIAIPVFLFLISGAFAQNAPTRTTAAPEQRETWTSVGPDGGDVRSLSYDPANPRHILLGTSAGQIYQSNDGGGTWTRFVRIGKGNDFVVDHILFDPKDPQTLYVAAWRLEEQGGEVFKSTDAGHTWTPLEGMRGKSVRALAMAPSDSHTLVAGALDGVFRSSDAGATWQRISPESSAEIKNVESIAVDPTNPDVVYAGTWHLPWKTSDGGKTWKNIKNGVIDDSDVFSIIIDPKQPQVVYASACSGIYKSESAGELFHKIQGIPFSARRTRVLKQDPANQNIVYAGTTEGLWKTSDAGRTWAKITGSNVIVNDVLVDVQNPEHVLLATDRSGVLASNNGGNSFMTSNTGFAHRQVAALTVDPQDDTTLYAGVVNDKEYGGAFVSHDRGLHWKQMSTGLLVKEKYDGSDVFTIRKTGVHLLAGTSHGVFKLDGERWVPLDHVVNEKEVVVRKATKTRKAIVRKEAKTGTLTSRVTDIEVADGKWYAASSSGLYTSTNSGRTWEGGPVLSHASFHTVRVSPKLMAASGHNYLVASVDGGHTWYDAKLPQVITSIRDIAIAPDDSLWIACREGLYRSSDGGDTWGRLERLPVVNLASIYYDQESRRMLVTAINSTEVFASADDGRTWQHNDTGWLLRHIRDDAGHLVASTAFDGIVVQSAVENTRAALPSGNR
jgi:photosystem II stability/assembly factor-like uncharacterized protein